MIHSWIANFSNLLSRRRPAKPCCEVDAFARSVAIGKALDRALEAFSDNGSLGVRDASLVDGKMAVQANSTQSLAVAQYVHKTLVEQGFEGAEVHRLRGHAVLRDSYTGLLHDLECYAGVRDKRSLPRYLRAQAKRSSLVQPTRAIERQAVNWVRQRLAVMGTWEPNKAV